MKLAKVRSASNSVEILANSGAGWHALSSLAGYEQVSRIDALLGSRDLAALAETLAQQPAGRAELDLDAAATITDRGSDIWGAGLNYRRHSEDLAAAQPASGPGSYLRPSNCLIDNGDPIELPTQSRRVTAEGELGLVIGTACKNVRRAEWRSVIAGVTAVLDMTAEDVIRENPRYIPWSKGFDTFCSIGPVLVSLDEFTDEDLASLQVSTVRNGTTIASATPSDMKYDLGYLVEYFTAGRTFEAGTVICTGTPGAAVINSGDTVAAVVERVGTLTHPVK